MICLVPTKVARAWLPTNRVSHRKVKIVQFVSKLGCNLRVSCQNLLIYIQIYIYIYICMFVYYICVYLNTMYIRICVYSTFKKYVYICVYLYLFFIYIQYMYFLLCIYVYLYVSVYIYIPANRDVRRPSNAPLTRFRALFAGTSFGFWTLFFAFFVASRASVHT